MGGYSADAFVSIPRMLVAALSRIEEYLFLASVQGSLGSPFAANHMRRLSKTCGGPARQDVSAATDCEAESEEGEAPFRDWAAYRGAERARRDSPPHVT